MLLQEGWSHVIRVFDIRSNKTAAGLWTQVLFSKLLCVWSTQS